MDVIPEASTVRSLWTQRVEEELEMLCLFVQEIRRREARIRETARVLAVEAHRVMDFCTLTELRLSLNARAPSLVIFTTMPPHVRERLL